MNRRQTSMEKDSQEWVYVEYSSGTRELYDMRADPYQIAQETRRRALHLAEVRATAIPVGARPAVPPPPLWSPSPAGEDRRTQE